MFHHAAVMVNVGGNWQVNPIFLCKCITLPLQEKRLSQLNYGPWFPRLPRSLGTILTDAEQLSPAGLLR